MGSEPMTGIQKACLFMLSASAVAGGTYAVYAGSRPAAGARSAAGWADPGPRAAAVAVRGTDLGEVGLDASGVAGFRAAGRVGDLDPAVLADLRREGIDLAAIDEFRAMVRDAVTPGDVAEKLRRLLVLRDRLARAAADDPDDERWWSGISASCAAVTRAGRTAASSVVESVTGVWDRLLHELDL